MNPVKSDISQDDILAKMDALLKKHHISADQVPVVEDDFPILSEIVEVKEAAKPAAPAPEDIQIDFDLDSFGEDFPLLEIPAPEPEKPAEISPEEEIILFSEPDLPEPEPLVEETPTPEPELVIIYEGLPDTPSTQTDETIKQPDLSGIEQRLAENAIAALDKALEGMLERFSTRLEAMVRETVSQELSRQLTALFQQDGDPGKTTD